MFSGRVMLILIISQTLLNCQSKLSSPATNKPDIEKGVAAAGTASPIPTFTLANNITVPLVGLGSASGVSYPHIQSAIEVGYRYVDTAQSHSWGYREEDVGKAVYRAKRRYEDWKGNDEADAYYVYVQTKIHPEDLGYQATKNAIQVSLTRHQATSLDSVLLHKPRCWEGACTREPEGTWHESWVALEEAVDAGVVRSIGMCDIDNRLFSELSEKRIGPTVIQNWFDPFHQDKVLRRRIAQHNEQHPERKVLYQAYSSLGTQWFHHKGYAENIVLNDPTLKAIASRHGMQVPQVVIQWATRQGVMVLPASRSRSHQAANLHSFSFTLSDTEMKAIDDLDGNPPRKQTKESNPAPGAVQLQFVNRVEGGPVNVYWVPKEGGGESKEEVNVGEMKNLGDVLKLTSYHGHTFVFKEGDGGELLNQYSVDISLGATQNHEVEDKSDEL